VCLQVEMTTKNMVRLTDRGVTGFGSRGEAGGSEQQNVPTRRCKAAGDSKRPAPDGPATAADSDSKVSLTRRGPIGGSGRHGLGLTARAACRCGSTAAGSA